MMSLHRNPLAHRPGPPLIRGGYFNLINLVRIIIIKTRIAIKRVNIFHHIQDNRNGWVDDRRKCQIWN